MIKKTMLMFALIALCGCSTILLPQNASPRDPTPLPQDVLDIANVASENPHFTSHCDEDGIFKGSVAVGDELLHFDYFKTSLKRESKDLVFIYRILSDSKGTVSKIIAEILLEEGYDCIVLQQENFLSHRVIRPVLSDGSSIGYDEYNGQLARGVARIINYWLPQQKQLSGRYAFVGISMGGIHAIKAASLFPDAEVTVSIMAGGGNADLLRLSQEGLVVTNRNGLLDSYAELAAAKYPNARVDYEQLLYDDLENLDFEVLRLARAIKTSKVRLMLTLNDVVVPTSLQWNLYHALGGPETRLFPCGHYTLAFYYFSVKDQLKKWINDAFEN